MRMSGPWLLRRLRPGESLEAPTCSFREQGSRLAKTRSRSGPHRMPLPHRLRTAPLSNDPTDPTASARNRNRFSERTMCRFRILERSLRVQMDALRSRLQAACLVPAPIEHRLRGLQWNLACPSLSALSFWPGLCAAVGCVCPCVGRARGGIDFSFICRFLPILASPSGTSGHRGCA